MNILIRADAYPEIALGHLRRCINLGKVLKEKGHDVEFVSFDGSSARQFLDESGISYQLIPYKINDDSSRDQELKILSLHAEKRQLLIIDSYNIDEHYIAELKGLFNRIVYIDDLGLNFDFDIVINPSCHAKKSYYKATNVLLGMDYVILDKSYQQTIQPNRGVRRSSILITMGGIDHYDLSSRVIPILKEIDPNIIVNIVIGPYYENLVQIRRMAIRSKLVINLLENISDLYPLIIQNDLAVAAGGFTTYELAATGTPAVGIALWDNQKGNVDCLNKKGALLPLFYHGGPEFDSLLKASLQKLFEDRALRVSMAKLARSAVDGCGAKRISEEITRLYG